MCEAGTSDGRKVSCATTLIHGFIQTNDHGSSTMKAYKHLGITFMDSQTCVKTYRTRPGATTLVSTPVCGNCGAVVDIRDDGEGCWAHVGYDPAFPRVLNVGAGCDHRHLYIHELGRVLGLHHEHSHPQREVIIVREALPQYLPTDPRYAQQVHQYQVLSSLIETPHDLNSIMHYDGPAICLPNANVRTFCDIDHPAGYLGCYPPGRIVSKQPASSAAQPRSRKRTKTTSALCIAPSSIRRCTRSQIQVA